MKPYKQIEEAKQKARTAVSKLYPAFQKIADDFEEETGGSIKEFILTFIDVTSTEDEYYRYAIGHNKIITTQIE